jgi:glycosyltransferase involved in cell wall biosynthesis
LEFIGAIVSAFAAFEFSTRAASPVDVNETPATSVNPLVSVIIPCYNGEAYLEETITSALLQTHKNVEILVIDDGSTDASSAIAQKMPVRYVRQENRGLTASRNRGIRESKGEFIVFLDADDRLKPDAVETGLRILQEHPGCAMTVGDHLFISETGAYLAGSQKLFHADYHYEALLQSNFVEMISSALFRKSVIEKVGGFDTSLRVAEDYDLYLRIAKEHRVVCHKGVIAEYRLHRNNCSHNSELMLVTTVKVLNNQATFARRNRRRLMAYLAGLRRWRRQYGRQLASELARSYHTLEGNKRRHKLSILFNYYPQGLLMLAMYRISPSLDKKSARLNSAYAEESKPFSQRMQAWFSATKAHAPKQIS